MELLEYKMLLEKYYEGNSSIIDERKLRLFLSTYNGKDESLLEAKELFEYSTTMQSEHVEIDFDAVVKSKSKLNFKRVIAISSTIAAIFIMGILITSVIGEKQEKVVYAYVNGEAITNKNDALKYSQQALQSFSKNFNKGTQNLGYLNKLNEPVHLITSSKN